MLGLTFTLIDVPKWHEDVKVYAVSDTETNELIGQFYLDIFPRDGKFNHAAAFTLVRGRELPSGKYQATLSAMVANFNKPSENSPSLLPHSDVVTLFHEFGHIMHQLVTTAKYSRFSGTQVKRDFVEVPSQMLENWVWEPVILGKISSHYLENKPLPEEMVNKLIAAKNAYSGLMYLRQVFFGKYDLIAYTEPGFDLVEKWNELLEEISLIKPEKGIAPAAFAHIIDGYDAGYYGYLWAEVFAKDMYTRFKKEGPTSKETGISFRRCVLEPGSSVEEASLIEKFLGRKPENKAFLESIGLE
ncbi:MAG: M3 family metallopeptidase [Candidatus Hodarchaeales archaeon]